MVAGAWLPLSIRGPLLLLILKKRHSCQIFICQGLSPIDPPLGFIVPTACSLESVFSLFDAVLEASSPACKPVITSRATGAAAWAPAGM